MLLRLPDPPPGLLLVEADPPKKTSGVFDEGVFDPDDEFDCGGFVTHLIADPGPGDMLTIGDPVAVKCEELQFDEHDFEASDFVIVYGSFCPLPDPIVVPLVTIPDPVA